MKRTIKLLSPDQKNFAYKSISDAMAEGKLHRVTIEPWVEQRTGQQNNALHLYCEWLADWLNDHGFYRVTKIKGLAKEIEHQWTKNTVKDDLVRLFLKAEAGHDSTSKATTAELSNAIEQMQDSMAQTMGVNIPFPSRYDLMNEVRK